MRFILKTLEINNNLDSYEAVIREIYSELLIKESYVTAERNRNIFMGGEVRHDTFLNIFKELNDNAEQLMGVGLSKATIQKYKVAYNHLLNNQKG